MEVKNGDVLNIGSHSLTFVFAPMVHWPEVMMTYESSEKALFSADGFGKFGALDIEEDWADEARRYYIGIVGKYGRQVQAVLKKAAALDIQMICPLHGPVLKENLGYYIDLYLSLIHIYRRKSCRCLAYRKIFHTLLQRYCQYTKSVSYTHLICKILTQNHNICCFAQCNDCFFCIFNHLQNLHQTGIIKPQRVNNSVIVMFKNI